MERTDRNGVTERKESEEREGPAERGEAGGRSKIGWRSGTDRRSGTGGRSGSGWLIPGVVLVLLASAFLFHSGGGAFSQSPRNADGSSSGVTGSPTFLQIQPSPSNTDMIAISTPCVSSESGEPYQQLVLIDTKKKVICVYHVDAELGQVSLQCVRPFQYDQEL
ncbi:MAG: hypothetical protein Q4C47_03360, partial [Planctomycetia bacterium]|nr:hypothetical protein [Planctomycetia bacterium]